MRCRQCLPLSVVPLKGKHCRKPHCRNGVVDTFGHCTAGCHKSLITRFVLCSIMQCVLCPKYQSNYTQELSRWLQIFPEVYAYFLHMHCYEFLIKFYYSECFYRKHSRNSRTKIDKTIQFYALCYAVCYRSSKTQIHSRFSFLFEFSFSHLNSIQFVFKVIILFCD